MLSRAVVVLALLISSAHAAPWAQLGVARGRGGLPPHQLLTDGQTITVTRADTGMSFMTNLRIQLYVPGVTDQHHRNIHDIARDLNVRAASLFFDQARQPFRAEGRAGTNGNDLVLSLNVNHQAALGPSLPTPGAYPVHVMVGTTRVSAFNILWK